MTTYGGVELGYAEITANVGSITTIQDITGLSVTVAVGARPIVVEFWCDCLTNNTANQGAAVYIYESTTQLALGRYSEDAANTLSTCPVKVRLAPAAGSHTYKIRVANTGAGTVTLVAAATAPAAIQVIEV